MGRGSTYNIRYSASNVNAASFILNKVVDLVKLETKNIVDAYGWHKQKNQQ
jgi:pantothenate kinase-related protein Tda10